MKEVHQGSALKLFLFAGVMDGLTSEVRQEYWWMIMFADDIAICSQSREQVEENLERWRYVLEEGVEDEKVQEFKYLRSTVQSSVERGKEVKNEARQGVVGEEKCQQ